jgi:hypothetical protein
VVTQTTPTLSGAASPSVQVGGSLTDAAALFGGFNPTGTISFALYGPGDSGCSGSALYTASAAVSGNGSYLTPVYTPTLPGTYYWTVAYSGDQNNSAVPAACGAANQTVTVTRAVTTVTSSASASIDAGQAVAVTAQLAGGDNPGGTITFDLFGPNNTTCSGTPLSVSSAPVTAGNGDYVSPPVTIEVPGNYQFRTSYSGDVLNAPASSACNAPAAEFVVNKGVPSLATTASSATVGNPIRDDAVLSGGAAPGGFISFDLYAPGDTNCSQSPIFVSSVSVSGDGSYASSTYTPSTVGTYRWVASYSGDADNVAVAGLCNDPSETVAIAGNTTTTTLTSSPNPSVFGQAVTFTATVTPVAGGAPSGVVTFYNGSSVLGTANLNQHSPDTAVLTTKALPGGTFSIQAVYGGSTPDLGSTSAVLTQTVNPVATTLTAKAGVNNGLKGTTTLSATLKNATTGVGISGQTITFTFNGKLFCSGVTNSTGVATCSHALLISSSNYTATFAGTADYKPSSGSARI